ncbi:hypothetical protein H2201_002605 [Coniosporium apollinis]|uniref:L-asparaginase n=1 Tax=Coniosporium apollinis TaxID=61459 RepID=A0ABQ9NYF1_9PEZI|nr:hypothetical protein H2201_002605 [Coniosporium apollinis]
MSPSSSSKNGPITPRIIIHGGAGNISRSNLPPASWHAYRTSLLQVLHSASQALSQPGATALDVAVLAVALLEDNPLFNAGKGAVFTRAGTNELEASIMVSNGYRKRGVGCMMLRRVKNPIKLAREMLVRGEEEGGGGGQGHCQLSGEYVEGLARGWGVKMVEPGYFWTRKRWEQHLKGLKEQNAEYPACYGSGVHETVPPPVEAPNGDPSWDGKEYLPQGTVGAVVLDSFGTVCVATSTGGMTNKLPGRIGDTPTLGTGFWAEEWFEEPAPSLPSIRMEYLAQGRHTPDPAAGLSVTDDLRAILLQCLPLNRSAPYTALPALPTGYMEEEKPAKPHRIRHAVAISGTGNGDSFLKTAACRTAAAMSRFTLPNLSLASSVKRVAGSGGELQLSAGDRWGSTGEGEGGIIGVEVVGTEGKVVSDFNCGGMFRAWVDEEGRQRCMVFKEEY